MIFSSSICEVVSTKLTVYFQEPFWVGIFEKSYDDKLEVCRVVFGAEPKDYEVYDFILSNFYKLQFAKPIKNEEEQGKKINPKRLQREIKKETENKGVGTKAQEAMRLELESRKQERKDFSKAQRDEMKQRKFELKQLKKKEKKKGH